MAKLLYAGEHLNCPNYETRQRPVIQEMYIDESTTQQIIPMVNKILFVLDGEMEYSMGNVEASRITKGQMLFIPAGSRITCVAQAYTHILVIRLYNRIQLCDCFKVEDLQRVITGEDYNSQSFLLEVNPVMEKYLDMLILCHNAGLRCRYYNEDKVKELMFIFRAFYSKEELRRFFSSALTTDTTFSQFVMDNSNRYNSLSEMAEAMNYTVSGFEKRFRKVFACSPYSWMKRRKAMEAYHYINTSDMSLKQISDNFGFNSPSAFNNFIKQHFGKTPGQIRENKKDGGNGQNPSGYE
ncbi:AraC family transcriptional regulator [Dysgonomonas sp. 521]|uniref:AraC family transcriptional regulator n=1 Tax=Dysgonomonas sp. 521 TaxID=2302932 RepID=UPI0013D51711|nr:helix-turn-helix domain-containing protein [Dysgonomonas sp. 521]NDV95154.1 AraC family transcriptional regulator [Dysgonomonas sp. 521]